MKTAKVLNLRGIEYLPYLITGDVLNANLKEIKKDSPFEESKYDEARKAYQGLVGFIECKNRGFSLIRRLKDKTIVEKGFRNFNGFSVQDNCLIEGENSEESLTGILTPDTKEIPFREYYEFLNQCADALGL